MAFCGYRICSHIMSILGVMSLFVLSGCGDSGPDRIEITPPEKSLEVGEYFQFKATAWSKDKERSDQTFVWQVEGGAGSIDNSGRFTAQNPGQALILAKTGEVSGKANVTVKSKTAPKAASEQEVKKLSAKADVDLSGLKAAIILENQDYGDKKKGPVTLSHLKHATEYGAACTDCHHEYLDGKNIWTPGKLVKRCADCHDPAETKDGVIKLQNAYHKNCRDCHKQIVEEGKSESAPYKKCTDCHEK